MRRWFAHRRYERLRRAALAEGPPAFLKTWLETPLPAFDSPAVAAPVLAVDLETNGLNAAVDCILSIGAVALDRGAIRAGTGWHQIVRPRGALRPEIVAVHGLTHDMVDGGADIAAALEALFGHMAGRIPLAHHSAIEAGFLMRAIHRHFGIRLPMLFLDTLRLEADIVGRRGQAGGLRLGEARRRYGLPDYGAHHALTDALAAGELFLAQASHHFATTPLNRLLTYHFPT